MEILQATKYAFFLHLQILLIRSMENPCRSPTASCMNENLVFPTCMYHPRVFTFPMDPCVSCHQPIHAKGSFPFECDHCSRRFNLLLDTVCNVCFKSFVTPKKRRDHMRVHRPRTHQCPDCDMAYRTASKLSEHRMKHMKNKKYKCEHCETEFAYRSSTVLHKQGPCGIV